MNSSNIEKFDLMAGQILGHLYKDFPMPIRLGASSFTDFTKERTASEQVEFLKEVDLFNATAGWLADSGYIRHKGVGENCLIEAVLTSQALLALKALPGSLSKGPTIGQKLSEFASTESREAFRGLVTEALGIGAKIIGPMIGVAP
ncbi:hypothetical protein HFV06_08615 [Pseudomonas fluorescens]|nr:hypothetical protein [Pseudomonas fluorescens]NKI51401.1 hypothetical protein [Pseudomonas fluorescens]NKI63894.1 hypothetical protein [Pseudomonas fluorescens]